MEANFVFNCKTPGNSYISTSIGGAINMSEYEGPRTSISAGLVVVGYPLGGKTIDINAESVTGTIDNGMLFSLDKNGVSLKGGDNNHVLTSSASTIDITQYALKTELPTVPTNVSQLTNDSNFIT